MYELQEFIIKILIVQILNLLVMHINGEITMDLIRLRVTETRIIKNIFQVMQLPIMYGVVIWHHNLQIKHGLR